MDKLEFRAWNIHDKKYIENIENIFVDHNGEVFELVDYCNESCMYDITYKTIIERYTGAKDKAGNKIFENDIVCTHYAKAPSNELVTWCEETLQFITVDVAGIEEELYVQVADCKVIGNINQNILERRRRRTVCPNFRW